MLLKECPLNRSISNIWEPVERKTRGVTIPTESGYLRIESRMLFLPWSSGFLFIQYQMWQQQKSIQSSVLRVYSIQDFQLPDLLALPPAIS